ncbi:MAG: zinc ABC transporter substrate-binding protein [Chloroflexi bacterium]|nr:zinc ABC transporter substrate-binding protein [Chloroflexota bacterium]
MIRSTYLGGLAVVLVLVACAAAPAASDGEATISVVATTTQVGSIVAEIGAEDVALTVLLEPGIEAHDFELTPAAGAAIENADLILKSGAGLELWLDEAVETIGGAERIRDLSTGVEQRDDDPHYWLTGQNAVTMVQNARDGLASAAPDAATAITERAETLISRLEAADAEVRALMAEIPADRRTIVTDHDALGYFIEAYGLRFGGSVFPSLDVTAEPSAQEIEELVAAMRADGVRAIFTESAVDPRLARAVAEETEAEVVDEPLYTDSLGPAGSGADTLDGMLLHNATVIHDALVVD